MLLFQLATFAFLVLMLATAIMDLTTMTIPNPLNLALLGLFLLFALLMQVPPAQVFAALGIGALGLLLAGSLYAFGVMGGGDVKFIACALPWFGYSQAAAAFAIWSVLYGGALCIVLLMLRAIPMPAFVARQGWIMRLHEHGGGVPYGIAMAAAGIKMSADVFAF